MEKGTRKIVTLQQAVDSGVISLSKGQLKKAKAAGVVKVSYSFWAGTSAPLLLDEYGLELFLWKNPRLVSLG